LALRSQCVAAIAGRHHEAVVERLVQEGVAQAEGYLETSGDIALREALAAVYFV
jgi:hypothetical protein